MKKQLNGLERAIAFLSPQLARKRFANKLALDMAVRQYEAASITRLRKTHADSRSKDQINYSSVEALRYRARFLDENHDLAKSVLNTLVGQIIGAGIKTFPQALDKSGELADKFNKEAFALWNDWTAAPEVTQEYDWAKAQRLMARTWFRDGEGFAQQVQGNVSGLVHGTEVSYSLEMIEADMCPVGLMDSAANIVQGVQKSQWGRPTNYWMHKAYPTEGAFNSTILNPYLGASSLDRKNLKNILATNMIHLKMVERIRETRGVSVFASVFSRLDDLKDYEESERIAARVGAAFALAITKSIDAEGVSTSAQWREMDLAPGIIADNLQPGEKIESIKADRPNNNLVEFRQGQLKAVAGATNAAYSTISKDYDGSYSSQRQEMTEQFGVYSSLRNEFIHNFIVPTYKRFVEIAVLQGLLNLENVDPRTLFKAVHVGKGQPYIDPKKEADADVTLVTAGFKSRSQVIIERGGDPNEVREQIVKEREKDAEDGLTFSTVEQPAPEAKEEPDTNEDSTNKNDTDKDDTNTEDGEATGEARASKSVRRGRRGKIGPMPRHEIKNSLIRFETAPGVWGDWFSIFEKGDLKDG